MATNQVHNSESNMLCVLGTVIQSTACLYMPRQAKSKASNEQQDRCNDKVMKQQDTSNNLDFWMDRFMRRNAKGRTAIQQVRRNICQKV